MKPGDDTLLIVDLQRAFDVPPRLVENITRYAARFRRRVFTRFVNPPGSLFRRRLRQRCCAPGSEDTELLIPPGPDDLVFTKASYGLAKRDLTRLKRMGVKCVTVCGIDTDACVLGVMYSLFDAGIACRAKAAYCWSTSGLHRAGLQIIRSQFEVLD